MSDTKFTPGPFHAQKRKDGNVEICDENGAVLATVYGNDDDDQCWPVTANANLFVASPDLFAACEAAINQGTPDGFGGVVLDSWQTSFIRVIIAKVKDVKRPAESQHEANPEETPSSS